jgi:LytTr DNA-binding domain
MSNANKIRHIVEDRGEEPAGSPAQNPEGFQLIEMNGSTILYKLILDLLLKERPDLLASLIPYVQHPDLNRKPKLIGLTNYLGVQFRERNDIVLFRYIGETLSENPYWEALLADKTQIKLSNHTTGEKILSHLDKDRFFQINQTSIINLAFLQKIISKTRECKLNNHSGENKLIISQTQFAKLKALIEII